MKYPKLCSLGISFPVPEVCSCLQKGWMKKGSGIGSQITSPLERATLLPQEQGTISHDFLISGRLQAGQCGKSRRKAQNQSLSTEGDSVEGQGMV